MKRGLFARLISLLLVAVTLFAFTACAKLKLPNIFPQINLPFGAKNEHVMAGTVNGVDSADVYSRFDDYYYENGYGDCALKSSQVCDYGEEEVVGLCRADGDWYGLVSVLAEGNPTSLFCEKMTDKAMYLVQRDGLWYILVYSQTMNSAADGGNTVTNQFQVFRFDANGEKVVLDEKKVTYNTTTADATATSNFFAACNQYLENAQIVVDPYRLQGKMWPDSVDYGTIPNESTLEDQQNTPAYPQEETLGFVQINDPKTWLNLREGPGTNYPCVYMEPGNKKSIVKQAQGSPVTILETIETGDAKNPTWVKIRISYGGKEIVGYSSKKYIRVAE